MNKDTWFVAARYILIGGGAFLAGKGYVTMDQVHDFADKLPTIVAGVTSAAATIWGLYVRFGTKAVPVATAARADVPTVSAATGAVKP